MRPYTYSWEQRWTAPAPGLLAPPRTVCGRTRTSRSSRGGPLQVQVFSSPRTGRMKRQGYPPLSPAVAGAPLRRGSRISACSAGSQIVFTDHTRDPVVCRLSGSSPTSHSLAPHHLAVLLLAHLRPHRTSSLCWRVRLHWTSSVDSARVCPGITRCSHLCGAMAAQALLAISRLHVTGVVGLQTCSSVCATYLLQLALALHLVRCCHAAQCLLHHVLLLLQAELSYDQYEPGPSSPRPSQASESGLPSAAVATTAAAHHF